MKDFTIEYCHGRLARLIIDGVEVSPGSLRRIAFEDEAAGHHPALSIELCGRSDSQAFSMKDTAQDVAKTRRGSVPYSHQPLLYGGFPGSSNGGASAPPNNPDTVSDDANRQ